MTYYGGKDLARSFRQVRGNTIQTAEDIPEDKYGFQASPDTRSIGAILAHIAVSTGFQDHIQRNRVTDLKDVNFGELAQEFSAEEAKPRTKAETIAYLESRGEAFASFLEGLSDEFLAEPVVMPPGAEPATKTRFEMLMSAKEHEMHHRGQLMLIQRMIGLVPHLTRRMQERMAQHTPAKTTP
ncbi:MAG: DinB family protein [Gemmatimonadota bacterium]|nr:DinB family protein [Gemmatimonadota bacterium]